MVYTCPKCGAIAEWNAYYGRYTCTRCTWEAKKWTDDELKLIQKHLDEHSVDTGINIF